MGSRVRGQNLHPGQQKTTAPDGMILHPASLAFRMVSTCGPVLLAMYERDWKGPAEAKKNIEIHESS